MQNVATIDLLDPNQKQVIFTQSAWLNLRKAGDTQYKFIGLVPAQSSPKQTTTAAPKAAKSGCGCGKKK
jgi:hypothetical protein